MRTLLLGSAGMSALDEVVPAAPAESRLGFLATAADVLPDAPWVAAGQAAFRARGYDVVPIEPGDSLTSLDVVFATGGNTYYLLQQIRRTDFAPALTEFLDRGGVYAGASAGAIVAGPDIDLTGEPDQKAAAPDLASTRGLGWVGFSVLPHAGNPDRRFREHHTWVMNSPAARAVWRITDNEAIHVHGDQATLLWSPRDAAD